VVNEQTHNSKSCYVHFADGKSEAQRSPVSHSDLTPSNLNINPVSFLFVVVVFYDPIWQKEKGENRKKNIEKNTNLRSPTGRWLGKYVVRLHEPTVNFSLCRMNTHMFTAENKLLGFSNLVS